MGRELSFKSVRDASLVGFRKGTLGLYRQDLGMLAVVSRPTPALAPVPDKETSVLARTFYVSAISPDCTEVDIQVILGQSQVRNRRLDVTGMLAKSDGHFCQVVEGRPDAVDQVMARVRKDKRHQRLRVLMELPCQRRLFEGWSMGLIVRDDMAAEMKQLHETGALAGVSMNDVITRLMPSQAPPRRA